MREWLILLTAGKHWINCYSCASQTVLHGILGLHKTTSRVPQVQCQKPVQQLLPLNQLSLREGLEKRRLCNANSQSHFPALAFTWVHNEGRSAVKEDRQELPPVTGVIWKENNLFKQKSIKQTSVTHAEPTPCMLASCPTSMAWLRILLRVLQTS